MRTLLLLACTLVCLPACKRNTPEQIQALETTANAYCECVYTQAEGDQCRARIDAYFAAADKLADRTDKRATDIDAKVQKCGRDVANPDRP